MCIRDRLKASGDPDSQYDGLMKDFESGTLKYSDLKGVVADSLVHMTSQFIERKAELKDNKRELKYQVKQSSEVIRKRAQQTLSEVKDLVGLLNIKF